MLSFPGFKQCTTVPYGSRTLLGCFSAFSLLLFKVNNSNAWILMKEIRHITWLIFMTEHKSLRRYALEDHSSSIKYIHVLISVAIRDETIKDRIMHHDKKHNKFIVVNRDILSHKRNRLLRKKKRHLT